MRVALLTDGISPYVTGGMQRHSFNLCSFLASQGVHVDLYHCDPGKRIKDDLSIFSPDARKNITSVLIRFPELGKLPGHYIRESYEYSRLIGDELLKRPPVDFIYAKGFTAWSLLHRRAGGKIKLPPVGVNFHGYEMFQGHAGLLERLKAKWLLQSPVKYITGMADFVFSYGGKVTDVIASIGVQRNRIVELPGAVDSSWLSDKPNEAAKSVRFLFVGRDEPRKGLSELLRAYESAFPGIEKPPLTLVGPHSLKRVPSGVHLLKEQNSQIQLMNIYRDADVLVVPSFAEGFPNVILEAMASGLAVIATDTGAVKLCVNSDNGWLLPSNDVRTLAPVLQEAASMRVDLLHTKKQNSIHRIRNEFLWETVGTRLIDFLKLHVGKE